MTDAERPTVLRIAMNLLNDGDEVGYEVLRQAAEKLKAIANIEAERDTLHRKFIEAYSAACPFWAINTGDLDAMVANIKRYRESKETDAKRLADIDAVFIKEGAIENLLDGNEFKTGDLVRDFKATWGVKVFDALIAKNLLPKAEGDTKLPDIECSGCKKVIPDADASPCDMCGGSVCGSCTGEDGACKQCTSKCCTACWFFKDECICNEAEAEDATRPE